MDTELTQWIMDTQIFLRHMLTACETHMAETKDTCSESFVYWTGAKHAYQEALNRIANNS